MSPTYRNLMNPYTDPVTARSHDVFEPPRAPAPAFPDGHFKPCALEPSVLGVPIREFDSGATRDQDTSKFDYEGFLSPLALTRFAAYMHKHRVQSDGSLRDSDNWQKGIPLPSYMKSLWRHLVTVWRWHRRAVSVDEATTCESMEDALCGVIFNAQGYLHEIMKAKEGE